MAQENTLTLDQLKAEMRMAIDSGDNASVARLAKAIQKHSSDIVKVEADKAREEAEALAGDREKLAKSIHKAIKGLDIDKDIAKMKAKGLTYMIDRVEHPAGEPEVRISGATMLMVPAIRKGGGGGGTGVTVQSRTGFRRSELIAKYATDDEKAAIQAAYDNAGSSPGSARWGAEKPVVKRILASHPELIK